MKVEWSEASPIEASLLMEEGLARIGHQLRNHLGAVRNAAFYLSTRCSQVELLKADQRIAQFFQLIDDQLTASAALTERGHLAVAPHARIVEMVSTQRLVEDLLATFASCPWAVPVDVNVEPSSVTVVPAEFVYGLARLVAGLARETKATRVTLSAGPCSEGYAFSVSADRTGEQGELQGELCWILARRMAVLANAEFERRTEPGRLSARLLFRSKVSEETLGEIET